MKKKYITPTCKIIEMETQSILAASNNINWTTSDEQSGNSVIEEDPDNPFSDDSF